MAVLLLLHSVYNCDVFWQSHVAIFTRFLSEVVRQPMLKAVMQFRCRAEVKNECSNTAASAVCHHGVMFTGPQERLYVSPSSTYTSFISQQVAGVSAWRYPRSV